MATVETTIDNNDGLHKIEMVELRVNDEMNTSSNDGINDGVNVMRKGSTADMMLKDGKKKEEDLSLKGRALVVWTILYGNKLNVLLFCIPFGYVSFLQKKEKNEKKRKKE